MKIELDLDMEWKTVEGFETDKLTLCQPLEVAELYTGIVKVQHGKEYPLVVCNHLATQKLRNRG